MKNYKNLFDLKVEPIERVAFMGALMCNWFLHRNFTSYHFDELTKMFDLMNDAGFEGDIEVDIPLY